jgi:CheY-like chemotaxis protein
MEVICENCNARLNVPDDKLPRGKKAAISCPMCKKRQIVDVPPEAEDDFALDEFPALEPEPEEELFEALGQEEEMVEEPVPAKAEVEEDGLDFYEDRVKLALVMESDEIQVDQLRQYIEELGYQYVSAETTQAAIGKMRLHQFDLIILFDRFDGIELGQSPILEYLNNLALSVRRKIFLALIGDRFKTLDNMKAFAMSANVVVDSKDVDRLTTVLRHAISDNEKFYKVFMDTLAEVGKT